MATAAAKKPAAPRPSRAKSNTAQKAKAAGATVPEDHQPAKSDVRKLADTPVEWAGKEYLIEAEAMDDMELLEDLSDGNFISALRSMLGPQQWADYKEEHRDPDTGRVKVSDAGASEFLDHCLKELKRKNS